MKSKKELNPLQQKIIKLLSVGDLKQREIAERVGCSERNVRKVKRKYFNPFKEHCDERGVKPKDVDFYWDKTKEFSMKVHPNKADEINLEEKLNNIIKNYKPTLIKHDHTENDSQKIAQFFYSDVHVGMDPNSENKSLYGGSWSKNDLLERLEVIKSKMLNELPKSVDCLQVINLGDFADGLDKKTVRRQHELPQNMNNTEVFDLGVEFKTKLLEFIYANFEFNRLIWYNVCNSNHSSDFDYMICRGFELVAKNFDKVEVINERRFIGHIVHGIHCEIISHGKDDINLKFGFRPTLDEKGAKKIDEYIKFHNLQNYNVTFHKGDSHLRVDDKTNPNFDYCSYYALSPSSSWVQVNFCAGRSGFTIKVKDKHTKSGQVVKDFEFKWNSNKLL